MNYTTDAGFVGHVYKRAIGAGKRVLIYEGDSDACGLQTAPIEDIWAPFLSNGTGEADQWTPVGPLNTSASAPLRLPRTQPWRPFGLEPSGRKARTAERRGPVASAGWTVRPFVNRCTAASRWRGTTGRSPSSPSAAPATSRHSTGRPLPSR